MIGWIEEGGGAEQRTFIQNRMNRPNTFDVIVSERKTIGKITRTLKSKYYARRGCELERVLVESISVEIEERKDGEVSLHIIVGCVKRPLDVLAPYQGEYDKMEGVGSRKHPKER